MLYKIILFILFSLNVKENNIVNNKLYCYDTPKINIAEGKIKEEKQILKNNLQDNLLATITIDKIKIYNKPIYKMNTKENNINKNITILKNDEDLKVLVAHSGIGEIAYFKNLYKLEENDIVSLKFNERIDKYIVKNIYEEEKDGTLEIEKKYDNELVLTTCSYNKGKQLIIETEKVI